MQERTRRTKRKPPAGSLEELLQTARVLLKSAGRSPMTAERKQYQRWGRTWTKMVGSGLPSRGD